ncbi:phosphoribosylformylglycinamidine cyclo-ligase [bacterium]|nr:phosphoribosylformylglycinamidine cyclo-ligase [bacterium]MBU1921391.1 phosphoribosylformylglycinamidine cyclo-ligase [bacterium]
MTDYSTAGVSLDRGSHAKKLISKAAKATFTPEVLHGIGHFGGFFALGDQPGSDVLVASTDGVGTKVLLGIQLGMIDSLGQDLVNHSVNDILCCGAQPLFFLDYMAFGKLEPEIAGKLGESLAQGCIENGIALIGGETAEMPGLYHENHFDLAGTIVGKVRRNKILDASRVKKGDILIGIASSGLHTNGYSLVRRVYKKEIKDDALHDIRLPDRKSLASALMTPHHSYFTQVYPLIEDNLVNAISHITGGGLLDNTARVVPKDLSLNIDWEAWPRPALFKHIQEHGSIQEEEMRAVFNLGIGLVLIVSEAKTKTVLAELDKTCGEAFKIGRVE